MGSESWNRWCPRSILGMPGCTSSGPTDLSTSQGRRQFRWYSRNPMRSVPDWHRYSWTAPSGSARFPVSIASDSMPPARSSSPQARHRSLRRSWRMSWGCTSPRHMGSESWNRWCPRSILGMPGCTSSGPTDLSTSQGRRQFRWYSRNPMRSVPDWHRYSWTAPSGSARFPVSIASDSMPPARSSSPQARHRSLRRSWRMSWGCTSPHHRASASSNRSYPRSIPHWRSCTPPGPSRCSTCQARMESESWNRSCPRSVLGMQECRRPARSCCSMCQARRESAR